ncbi:transcriptional regulator [Kocuria rhizophila]|uniref:transcriptional regulator n=1 Tax=Kocuria rhizophila TaxID=72000 RepID=UPI00190BBC3B|nr:transcriptional regulator [Kocuria rhizophila]MBK4120915.1 transcriptional regulator [Kocuria rhizophila]
MTEQRVFFHHLKPYAVPDSLDELHGPSSGWVELSHSLYWAPGPRRFNLDDDYGIWRVYVSALAEGTLADVQALVNTNRLMEIWNELVLPTRVRDLWEAQFPELAAKRAPEPETLQRGRHSLDGRS